MALSYEWRCYVQVRTPNFWTSRGSWMSGPTNSRTQGVNWSPWVESSKQAPACWPGKALLLSGPCWTFDIWNCGYHRSSIAQIFQLVKDERQYFPERYLHRASIILLRILCLGLEAPGFYSQVCMLILIIILTIECRVDEKGQRENDNSLKSNGIQWLKVPSA